jgi:hypothetical protein
MPRQCKMHVKKKKDIQNLIIICNLVQINVREIVCGDVDKITWVQDLQRWY